MAAGDPDAPTEALRTATRRLERLPADEEVPWHCTRCHGAVEAFSTGHYQDTCRDSLARRGFHFCCPRPAGCELRAA